MKESPRWLELRGRSRSPQEDELDAIGPWQKLVDVNENDQLNGGTVMPVLGLRDVVIYTMEVDFEGMSWVVRKDDDFWPVDIVAAKIYFVESDGKRKVVICDHVMSHEIPLDHGRNRRRWDHLMTLIDEIDRQDNQSEDTTELDGVLPGEENYAINKAQEEMSDDEWYENYEKNCRSDGVEFPDFERRVPELIWQPGWVVEEVLRAVYHGKDLSNIIFMVRGRMGKTIDW